MASDPLQGLPSSPVLKIDAYELSMLTSLVNSGKADEPAVFEAFTRKLPQGRRFALTVGLGRFTEALTSWTLEEAWLQELKNLHLLDEATCTWLRRKAEAHEGSLFTGSLRAYPEGSLYGGNSPLVQVEASLGEGLLLETLLLSMLNHDSAVASAAARMVLAAQGRPLMEMGSRRTQEDAALAAARAAYIAGFTSTSNVAAALRYGIPTGGTAAHAYVLAHASEEEAFRHQLETWGPEATLLVDTYSISEGIKHAVEAAQALGHRGPGAVRLDSGDLLVEADKARKLLDSLGATSTRIVASSDLDEYLLTELQAAPLDAYGVGTRVVTGSGHPTAGMVYKLVEISGRPVAKKSSGKSTLGGKKTPYRTAGGEEYFTLEGSIPSGSLPLYEEVVTAGKIQGQKTLEEVRTYCAQELSSLTPEEVKVSKGPAPKAITWDGR